MPRRRCCGPSDFFAAGDSIPRAAATGPTAQQFQIRDLFIVTGLVAVALAALRFGIAFDGGPELVHQLGLFAFGGTLAVVGLLSAMPPLWAAFEIKEWQAGIALLLGYAVLLTCAELALITPFTFGGGGRAVRRDFRHLLWTIRLSGVVIRHSAGRAALGVRSGAPSASPTGNIERTRELETRIARRSRCRPRQLDRRDRSRYQ